KGVRFKRPVLHSLGLVLATIIGQIACEKAWFTDSTSPPACASSSPTCLGRCPSPLASGRFAPSPASRLAVRVSLTGLSRRSVSVRGRPRFLTPPRPIPPCPP